MLIPSAAAFVASEARDIVEADVVVLLCGNTVGFSGIGVNKIAEAGLVADTWAKFDINDAVVCGFDDS